VSGHLLVTQKLNLLFVSPRFLFPTDSGGKIRTTQILRGMKGANFHITLMTPITSDQASAYKQEINSVCDELISWEPHSLSAPFAALRKAVYLLKKEPVPVATDYDATAAALIRKALQSNIDLVVFDFPHSAVLAPTVFDVPSVMFTHNVEAEIFQRHWQVAKSPIQKMIWHNQYRKMQRYEKDILPRFTTVVAVSERDCDYFSLELGIVNCRSIPTGVDTGFFRYQAPTDNKQVVFCGSMDWMANIDGIEYFFAEVWPLVRNAEPTAQMKVIGRNPPPAMVQRMTDSSIGWEFSGFVDDVREHVGGAAAFVIPLRVGGGTRIKAFEAMAMGCPVVSTTIGMEGLPVSNGVHFLQADKPTDMANRIIDLLRNNDLRSSISHAARAVVEEKFGFKLASSAFEAICLDTIDQRNRSGKTAA
jgi:glycosyltransferase involved in cell wall biosynthesis